MKNAIGLSDFIELVSREINLGVQKANQEGFINAFVPEEVEFNLNLTMQDGQIMVLWPEHLIYSNKEALLSPVNRCKLVLPLKFR
jgi:hypothetical protein